MIQAANHRRGFAMIMAIVLLGLVALSGATLATTFAGQSRRTLTQMEDAQLRQLLLAGAMAARVSDESSSGQISVVLPKSLLEQGANLTLEFEPSLQGQSRNVQISARFADRRMSQRVEMAQSGGKWWIIQADLVQ